VKLLPSYRRGRPETNFVFPYSEVVLRRGKTHLPMAQAALSWTGSHEIYAMLVDTGAESSFVTPAMASLLGLELGEERWVYPIGQRFTAKTAHVRIQLVSPAGGRSLPRTLEVLVPVDGDFLEIPILGRTPFLNWYEMTVRNWKREFVLRETAPPERVTGRKAVE
jgi:hypothetical protein